jgi:predicted RNA-binding protein with PUA-like domain
MRFSPVFGFYLLNYLHFLILIGIFSTEAFTINSMGKRKASVILTNAAKKAVQSSAHDKISGHPCHFLLKSEPDVFGIDHLAAMKDQTSLWDGVRNNQARNILKEMKLGDRAFFYHSSAGKATGVYGIVEVVREAYPDPTQSDASSKYYDEKQSGTWVSIDVKLLEKWDKPVLLSSIKGAAPLASMMLLKNSRLSVQRVTPEEWSYTVDLMHRS